MTFSIVARDPATGQLGVAVTTCALAVGRAAPWARAGVGAVATQAHSQRGYGPRLLTRLAAGDPAGPALDGLLARDAEADQRQVAGIGPAGPPAAWTGVGCLSACGHRLGPDFSAQGNMLSSRSVVPSVAEGYAEAAGDFAGRLVAALRAGDAAGGDLRGKQSAALVVVSATRDDEAPWEGVLVDLRVDDAADPVGELARLLRLQRAYETGDYELLAAEAPEGVRELHGALAAAARGDRDGAREALRTLRERPGWEGWLRRLRVNGRLPATDELLRY
ncbi:MAG TPA: DUF1028 domain-containing protein [Mycobacteriales bacterium]|jgi:uncharacterized Ntn-hydrolase superfamily protein|nr:DUF1028 domain-containing protein [Mycobacteriales bacterium]